MKTILTLLIAILAFAGTVAWAGEARPAAAGSPSASAPAHPAQPRASAAAKSPGAPRPAVSGEQGTVRPGTDFRIELPDAPAVFCACVTQRRLG